MSARIRLRLCYGVLGLSITDQLGGYDLISLALNLLAFAALVAIWRPIMRRGDAPLEGA